MSREIRVKLFLFLSDDDYEFNDGNMLMCKLRILQQLLYFNSSTHLALCMSQNALWNGKELSSRAAVCQSEFELLF